MNKIIVPFLLTLVLTACGGGGGGGGGSSQPVVSPIHSVLTISQFNTVYTEAVGDVNGDGREDVVIGGWNYDAHTAYLYLLTQNADGTLTDNTALLGNNIVGGSQRIIVADFDNDGHTDIFVPGFSDGAMVYAENSVMFWGNGTAFTRENWTDQSMAHGACTADLNNDGLTDLLISGSGAWINNGNRHFTLNNTLFANNYFSACAVIRGNNSNTIYLGNNNAVAGYLDAIFVFDYQLNLLSTTGYQTNNQYDTVNVVVADLSNDGHKDFVISMNGIANGVAGPTQILAYTAPNTYTSSITNISNERHAFYDRAISINGVDGVVFSGDYLNAKIFKGLSELYANILTTMSQTQSFHPANIYQNASNGKMYMLQLINNTFYTKEVQ